MNISTQDYVTIPAQNAPLTEKAMLAGLTISSWSARKQVKQVAEEAGVKHGADATQLNATKSVIAKSAFEKIKKIEGEARTYHGKMTLPWLDKGRDILTVALFWEYSQEMTRLRQEHEAAVNDLVLNYPAYVVEAQTALGSLYDAGDYPAPDKIAGKFNFEVNISPLPTGDDFRVSLGTEEEERIRAQIDGRLQEGVKQAMADLWSKVHEAVTHMATKLRAYVPADKTSGVSAEGIFRDSLVENLREIVKLLPAMNLTGDARLAALTTRLEAELCDVDAEDLRVNDNVRESVANSADQILADMAGYIGE